MNDIVKITENGEVLINITAIESYANEFTHCKECGCELFGGERMGEGANGYCDTCN